MVQKKYEKETFGFTLLPIYNFSRLIDEFSAATWLGRTVYLMSHLFGAIPHFNVVIAMAKHIFLNAAISQQPNPEGNGKSFSQKAVKIQEDAEECVEAVEDVEEDDIQDVEGVDWGDLGDRKVKDPEEILIHDFALATLLQEQDDAEEAKKLQDEERNRFPIDDPRGLSHEDDQAIAERLQAQLYNEENDVK